MTQSLLEIKNLSLAFGKEKNVINQLNYSISEGETIGIVGESGSGKSITSLSVVGLLPSNANINSGQILFRKEDKIIDLLHLNSEEKRRIRGKEIAMIFQEPMTSLNPVMKCGEQVAEVIRLHEKKNKPYI